MHRKQISFKKTTLTRRIYGKEETRGKNLNNETKQSNKKNPNNQTKEGYHTFGLWEQGDKTSWVTAQVASLGHYLSICRTQLLSILSTFKLMQPCEGRDHVTPWHWNGWKFTRVWEWPPLSCRIGCASLPPHLPPDPMFPATKVLLLVLTAYRLSPQQNYQRPRFVQCFEIRSHLRRQRKIFFIWVIPIYTHLNPSTHIQTCSPTSLALWKVCFYFKDTVKEGQLLNHISPQSTQLWN